MTSSQVILVFTSGSFSNLHTPAKKRVYVHNEQQISLIFTIVAAIAKARRALLPATLLGKGEK
jgi:hypothetical protein